MEKKIPLASLITGIVAAVLISAGTFFRLYHWPAAHLLLIIGTCAFSLFYLPLWLISELKKGNKFLVSYQFIVLLLLCVTYVFRTLHWPFGLILFNVWMLSSIFVVFPVSLFRLFKARSKSPEYFHMVVVLFLLGSLIIGLISNANRKLGNITNSFSKNAEFTGSSIERLKVKNNQFYQAFDLLANKEENPFYKKAVQLKHLTDSTENYIRTFRNHLVAISEGVSDSLADSISIKQLYNITASEAITHELLGTDQYKARQGKFSGNEFKIVIDNFRNSAINLIDGENKNYIKAGINLNTEPVIDDEGQPEEWISSMFRNIPVPVILVSLENIKYEIKNAETGILSDLLNSTKSNSNNLTVQIAELGAKLENQKKEREIESLKNDRQLSQMSMDAKNAEIDMQNKTIVWFIAGMILCSVSIFFIIRSNLIRKQINIELKKQKHLIEEKNKEITDSINYARRIQTAILPPASLIYSTLKNSFILYKPKDVVSGDFYAFYQRADFVLLAIADCTGHGVPGAFMSMIGNEQISKIINEKGITQPAMILDELHRGIREALKQNQSSGNETRDGMDIAICKYYPADNKIEYAGAMRPIWIVSGNSLIETKADKQAIGGLESEHRKPFTNHEIQLRKNDCIYLFTDGYSDQFGGEKGKKFMLKNFERLLLEISSSDMKDQAAIIDQKYKDWKGGNEQVDDILVAGIKV